MDSGLLLNRDSSENEYDVLQELGPKQVLGVMDELLGFEVGSCWYASLHKGYMLTLHVDVLAPGVPPLPESAGLALHRTFTVPTASGYQ